MQHLRECFRRIDGAWARHYENIRRYGEYAVLFYGSEGGNAIL